MNKELLLSKIADLCKERNISMNVAFVESGVGKNFKSNLKTANPTMGKVTMLAVYFGVSVDYLLGKEQEKKGGAPSHKGVKIPVLGSVAAGIPIEAITDIEDYEEITEDMANTGEYVALRIKGDSMSPKIENGDIVIVRTQSTIEDGETAIVLVNGEEATCKKIKKMPEGIILVPANSDYDTRFYSNKDIEQLPVRIFGKVVELRRTIQF